MSLLLDTHVVLWQLKDPRRLGSRARDAIRQATELRVSVVSFAEIGVKQAVGKLVAPRDLSEHVFSSGATLLGLAPEHGLGVADLPLHHRDPFDRLLISQARTEGLTVITADARFAAYDIPVIGATGP